MARGRQTKTLTPEQIELLHLYRLENAHSLMGLRDAMKAPFTSTTLKKALQGLPVYDFYVIWLTRWIDKRLRGTTGEPDGEPDESDKGKAARTVRGSR